MLAAVEVSDPVCCIVCCIDSACCVWLLLLVEMFMFMFTLSFMLLLRASEDGTAAPGGMLLINASVTDDGPIKGIGESVVCNTASLIV